MPDITFDNQEKELLVQKLKTYFTDELDQDIGQFDCEFLIDFISKEMGGVYYNKGLSDAEAVITQKFEDISDGLYELEQSTPFSR